MCNKNDENQDILEYYHPEYKNFQIPPINKITRSDPFNELRPDQSIVADYKISQTTTKLEAGFTRCCLSSTTAEYKYLPPGVAKSKTVKPPKLPGSAPKWTTVLERYIKNWKEEQKYYKQRLKFLRAWTAADKKANTGMEVHDAIMRKAGPIWWIELSPNQRLALDFLQCCILTDFKRKTMKNTMDNLKYLGIQCLPRSAVREALEDCVGNPVEFLMSFYEIMNPEVEENKYTLDDKLILSGIAHLQLPDVLYELHVRTPSPEREPPPPVIPVKKKLPKKAKSPYLQKLSTFRPDPPEFEGIYYDKHLQLPEHYYFDSYFRKMNMIRALPPRDICKPIVGDEDLINEIQAAQELRRRTAKRLPVVPLLPPFLYVSGRKEPEKPVPAPEVDKDVKRIIGGIVIARNGKKIVLVQGCKRIPRLDQCLCYDVKLPKYYDVCEEHNEDEDDNCLCPDNSAPQRNEEPPKPQQKPQQQPQQETKSCDDKKLSCEERLYQEPEVIIESPEERLLACICRCKEYIMKIINTPLCCCAKCEKERKEKCRQIFDQAKKVKPAKQPANDECNPENKTLHKQQVLLCDCVDQYKKKIEEYEDYIRRMNAVKKLSKQKENFVISGVMTSPCGPVYCIQGSYDENTPDCDCAISAAYRKEAGVEAVNAPHPPSGQDPFEVSGIQRTPEGNVYVLSNPNKTPACECIEKYDEFIKNHSNCLQLYEDYLKKMQSRMEEYASELTHKRQAELEPVIKDFEKQRISKNRDICTLLEIETCYDKDTNEDDKQEGHIEEPVEPAPCPCSMKEGGFSTSDPDKINLTKVESCPKIKTKDEKPSSRPRKPDPDETKCLCLEEEKDVECEKQCVCAGEEEVPCEEPCICGEPIVVEEEEIDYESILRGKMKRFFMLDEFPKKYSEQMALLKRVLQTIANDGYPLARLPQVEELPIFRLWFHLRNHRKLTKTDIAHYLVLRVKNIQHIGRCQARPTIRRPKFNFSLEERFTLTMAQFEKLRKMGTELEEDFARTLKLQQIDVAKEIFAILNIYDVPDHLRSIFSAYMPSKESDIVPYKFIWAGEVIDITKRKRCVC